MGRGEVCSYCWQVDRSIQRKIEHQGVVPVRNLVSRIFFHCQDSSLLTLLLRYPEQVNDFIPWAARNGSFLRKWVRFLLFTLPVSFSRLNPALSSLGSSGWVAPEAPEVRHKAAFSYFSEGPGFCFWLCWWLTETARSCLSCLSQRLETWNVSRIVTLPCVENSSIDYFPGGRCIHEAGADTGITHIHPERSGDQHKLCINLIMCRTCSWALSCCWRYTGQNTLHG